MHAAFMLAGFIGGWELVLILTTVLIMFGSWHLPRLTKGLRKGFDEFGDAWEDGPLAGFKKPVPALIKELEEDSQFHQPVLRRDRDMSDSKQNHPLVLLAQGLGIGRIPVAPGTFGSVLGVVWFLALLAPGNYWWYVLLMFLGIPISVWCCGAAEKILNQKDPGSIVLDEIIALPICFFGWVSFIFFKTGQMPSPVYFLTGDRWIWLIGVFAAFRFFDVLKPWPVKQSQSFSGGWGVTIDDVLAAVYVNIVVLVVSQIRA